MLIQSLRVAKMPPMNYLLIIARSGSTRQSVRLRVDLVLSLSLATIALLDMRRGLLWNRIVALGACVAAFAILGSLRVSDDLFGGIHLHVVHCFHALGNLTD